jgi:hypothetical protein
MKWIIRVWIGSQSVVAVVVVVVLRFEEFGPRWTVRGRSRHSFTACLCGRVVANYKWDFVRMGSLFIARQCVDDQKRSGMEKDECSPPASHDKLV